MQSGICSLCGRAASSAFCPYCQAPIIEAETQRQPCAAEGLGENQQPNRIEGTADKEDSRPDTSVRRIMLAALGVIGIAYAAYAGLVKLMLRTNIGLTLSQMGLLASLGCFLTFALMSVAWVYTYLHPVGRQSTFSRMVRGVLTTSGAIFLVYLAGLAVFVVSLLLSDWH